ncbi:uroporphyrinogen-III C-methyltransferase [Gracilibacillus sp. YIM 98692]|uniref:uroporphyrinogen-III C-methyltransferase n=1 Tax=Gracilibacillus sp. YIM 98692 TaxID=2663532 RepID=UPI0013D81A1E|nr:uroporphyrinogen-III C-methyltransferase [Gracilibacillus sp. YIM 98692]
MGKVYLVGAGPGDKELITMKGFRAIQEADVILYDRLINIDLLEEAKQDALLIFCGKKPNQHGTIQDDINRQLVEYAKQGKVVTRLKGGDPFIFGRGGEEALLLKKENIPYEVVPGITSSISAAAYAGIPLTHRYISGSVAFINGASSKDKSIEEWQHLVYGIDTLCFYMGVKQFPIICEQLQQAGLSPTTPVAVIHWGTHTNQHTTVDQLQHIVDRRNEFSNPSMVVIGEVVRLREELKWFEEIVNSEDFNLPHEKKESIQ